ncbi:MAG: hypothetical protein GX335_07955 [Firmicutes bacterium]|nr:hypothetical protein [Bacillota bacterium]
MQIKRKIVLALAAVVLTGSLFFLAPFSSESQEGPHPAQVIESLLVEQEKELKLYQEELIKEGALLYQQEQGKLRRRYQQELADAQRALLREQAELEDVKQRELSTKLLRLQLQLALVNLEQEEQAEKLKQIGEHRREFEEWREKAEEQLEMKLGRLKEDYEQSLGAELAQLQADLETRINQEFNCYQEWSQTALERKIQALDSKTA